MLEQLKGKHLVFASGHHFSVYISLSLLLCLLNGCFFTETLALLLLLYHLADGVLVRWLPFERERNKEREERDSKKEQGPLFVVPPFPSFQRDLYCK